MALVRIKVVKKKKKWGSLQTWKHSSGLSIFMHGVISLPDAMSYDKFKNFELIFFPPVTTFLVCICSLYFKQYGPRSDCSQGSSLIRVIVFISMMKSWLKWTRINSADVKSVQHFQDKKYLEDKGLPIVIDAPKFDVAFSGAWNYCSILEIWIDL